ncbi:hypothetical protein K788_00042305 (plasmid) [Paraburkholderia caribensis MBA4]|uniref:Uncharacterized protein n=1 Tax=Paraburkholderia caribensis MBA4 TaxID=1323664 RepID=A0A0P0RNS5_9BURK|nr:hypothetical protein K788_00042305 [Paraburkholderia caribensis MBA4]
MTERSGLTNVQTMAAMSDSFWPKTGQQRTHRIIDDLGHFANTRSALIFATWRGTAFVDDEPMPRPLAISSQFKRSH